MRIAVFASGRGSNFIALHRAIQRDQIPASIVAVISNNSKAGALEYSRSLNIPGFHISHRQFSDRHAFVQKVIQVLTDVQADFIVLGGYMKRMEPEIIQMFRHRIINIHPALLPDFGGKGMFGMHVHEAVIAARVPRSGATVHFVDEEYDHGAIVIQQAVDVHADDSAETLAAKVLAVEHELLPKAVALFAKNRVHVEHGIVTIQ